MSGQEKLVQIKKIRTMYSKWKHSSDLFLVQQMKPNPNQKRLLL